MHRPINKINKSKLIKIAQSSLDEQSNIFESGLSLNTTNETEYDNDNREIKLEKRDTEIRNKGDWESELSDMSPLKKGIIRRVSKTKELPNGLTPYEMMYGKQDDDYDIIGKSLE